MFLMKALPSALESEQAIIGCCLYEQSCIADAQVVLRNVDYFFDVRCRMVWEIIVASPVEANLATIQGKIKKKSGWMPEDSIAFLNACQDAAHSTAHLPVWLTDVEDAYTLRRLIAACDSINASAYAKNAVAGILDAAEREILAIRPTNHAGSDINSLVNEAITEIEYKVNNPGKLSGYTTGLNDLDRLTDGVHAGEVVVIAGFTSTGKTALGVNIATLNAIAGVPVAIFTAEMLPVKIVVRQICSTARANVKRLTEGDIAGMKVAAGKISHAPIYIENANGMTIGQVQAMARRLHQKHGIKIILIDYIQLLIGTGDNREQQISSISKGLKAIAIELKCCVLALSQLTDDGKLRESRAIGHDADSVWKLENNGEWQPQTQPIKLVVEKCRDGETGKVELIFQKQFTRFENVAKITDEDVPYYENH
jgi:replicative DNA helicase